MINDVGASVMTIMKMTTIIMKITMIMMTLIGDNDYDDYDGNDSDHYANCTFYDSDQS